MLIQQGTLIERGLRKNAYVTINEEREVHHVSPYRWGKKEAQSAREKKKKFCFNKMALYRGIIYLHCELKHCQTAKN